MHNGINRNQSHRKKITPEIPWKPQLRGKPAKRVLLIFSFSKSEINTTVPNLATSPQREFTWIWIDLSQRLCISASSL
jgi:hypothetical protein